MMGYGGYGGYPQQGGSNEAHSQGGNGFNSPGQGFNVGSPGAGGSQKPKAAQSLRPVSVKQILESNSLFQDSPLLVDGKELTQVVIVGRVNKVNVTATAIVYTIDDGSGVIDVKKFIEPNEEDQGNGIPIIQDGGYLKVIGRVKVFNLKKSVDAHKIMTVASVDEICHHILSITFTHLSITKPKPTARHGNAAGGDGTTFTGAAFGVAGGISGDFTSIQRQIMSLFQQYTHTTEGGDVNDICIALRGTTTADQIRAEIEQLMNEGHLYCTLDENHYKLTGSC